MWVIICQWGSSPIRFHVGLFPMFWNSHAIHAPDTIKQINDWLEQEFSSNAKVASTTPSSVLSSGRIKCKYIILYCSMKDRVFVNHWISSVLSLFVINSCRKTDRSLFTPLAFKKSRSAPWSFLSKSLTHKTKAQDCGIYARSERSSEKTNV